MCRGRGGRPEWTHTYEHVDHQHHVAEQVEQTHEHLVTTTHRLYADAAVYLLQHQVLVAD